VLAALGDLMDKISIKSSFLDSYFFILKQSWIALLSGLGFAFYMGHIDVFGLFKVVPIILGVFFLAALIVFSLDRSSLTPDGIVYQNWRNKDQLIPWHTNLEAKLLKTGYPGYIEISSNDLKKPIYIYGKKLKEDRVSSYIRQHSPENHKLREFINNGS